MMRAVRRGILLLFFCLLAGAETLDDAVAALARKISARLTPGEVARVTTRNSSSLSVAEAAKVQPALNRTLQRRVREPKPVDIAVTISENLRGYILVAEIKRENESAVEMAEFRPTAPAAPARPAVGIESKMLWEQDPPILDLAISGDQMLVLDTAGVSLYTRNAGKWERTASAPIVTNVRDPRGRMEVAGEALTVHLPGLTCSGSAKLASSMRCEEGGRFTAGRNTLAGQAVIFSSAEIGGDTLVAELDGRTHIYDAARAPQGAFDGWGSDFVALAGCGGRHVLASSAGDQHAPDSVTLYDVVSRAPSPVSDPLEFAGPVTALWPAGDGALAVIRNLSTGKYAAYALALDCVR
jgi:hypothetical protein